MHLCRSISRCLKATLQIVDSRSDCFNSTKSNTQRNVSNAAVVGEKRLAYLSRRCDRFSVSAGPNRGRYSGLKS